MKGTDKKMLMGIDYDMIGRAISMAVDAHKDQKAKDGEPYIEHIKRVALRAKHDYPDDDSSLMVLAILHDVVEDSDVSLDDVCEEFGYRMMEAVDAISKREDEMYREYIIRCAKDSWARKVKICDLIDHIALRGFDKISAWDISRTECYLKNLRYLMEYEESHKED